MVNARATSEARVQRHQNIRSLVVASKWDEAISQFRECVETLGPHVGLLCDWAGCYYEAGRFQECWSLVDRIVEEFAQAKEVLSVSSKWRTAVMLAKFYDEMGEPAKALDWLRYADTHCSEFADKKWIYLQEIRILSYFGSKAELRRKYSAATEMHQLDDNLKIETLHSLMWTEGILFGFDHASKRFQQLQKLELNALDQRLMARDFIELGILSKQFTHPAIEIAIARLQTSHPSDYDTALLNLIADVSAKNLDPDELQLSDMMKLRLLLLGIQLETKPEIQLQKKRKFLFLVSSFSEESQTYFKKIEPLIQQSEQLSLQLSPSDKRAFSSANADQTIALTGSEVKFLLAIEGLQQITLDEISAALWQSEGSESLYHRLRMLCYKLNEKLRTALGFTPFEVKKDGVTVHSNFKLTVRA